VAFDGTNDVPDILGGVFEPELHVHAYRPRASSVRYVQRY
jgi:hypothetical protein